MKEVIASRIYELIMPATSGGVLTVSFDKPYLIDDGGQTGSETWLCEVTVTGPKGSEMTEAHGVDSVQAIESAIQLVKPLVQVARTRLQAQVNWFGEKVDF